MPSDVAIGKRRQKAIQKIVDALGGDDLVLPTRAKRGAELHHLVRLEMIADYVEANGASGSIPKKYLDAEELARNGATKAQIVSVLLGESDE